MVSNVNSSSEPTQKLHTLQVLHGSTEQRRNADFITFVC